MRCLYLEPKKKKEDSAEWEKVLALRTRRIERKKGTKESDTNAKQRIRRSAGRA